MAKENKDLNEELDNMAEEEKGMKPIWFFVGLILMMMGCVLIVTGIYNYYNPSQSGTILEYLHPDIWWGGVMFITGVIFAWFTRNATVD